jgi:hypothetical protein
MPSINRNKRSFPFAAPVFRGDKELTIEIGRATTAEEAMAIYQLHFVNSGHRVIKAVKLKHKRGNVGPEYGWIPQFGTP